MSQPYEGDSTTPNIPGIKGTNSGGGVALTGSSTGGPTTSGTNLQKIGVLGDADPNGIGVEGKSQNGIGVQGSSVSGAGVFAISQTSTAIEALSGTGTAVQGLSGGIFGPPPTGEGVYGSGKNGVHGVSSSPTDSGVWGENNGHGYGVSGGTNSPYVGGPRGTAGVWGNNNGSGTGVKGTSQGGDAVAGFSSSNAHAGVAAINDSGGFGVWARGTPAGHFEGDVEVTGSINVTGDLILKNQDCAEDFDIVDAATIEVGSVMVISRDGALRTSHKPYDKKVAGVVSGAGDFKPGIILGKQETPSTRMPIALMGKVYCKVDADYSPVEVGDLLTTSPTPGHAMKATDPLKAFGCVIGKALRPLVAGRGFIPILIALQ